jgi:hypothetical protein
MEWVNPHGWIYVDVKGPDGQVKNWAVEAVAPNTLLRRGLRKEDFPIGSEIVVKGYKAKNGQPVANGRTVTFVNGRNFFLGSEGAGARTTPRTNPRRQTLLVRGACAGHLRAAGETSIHWFDDRRGGYGSRSLGDPNGGPARPPQHRLSSHAPRHRTASRTCRASGRS